MIGHSIPEYVFIRISITGLRLIAPLSIVYLLACAYTREWMLSPWLAGYAFVEATFYLLVYLPRSRFMQQAAEHPPLLSKGEREALFTKCFSSVHDTDRATGWFPSAHTGQIFKENVIEWLLWALFHTDRDGFLNEWEEELEGYVKMLEHLMGRKLDEGWNSTVRCMKVSLDPVVSLHRPFIWYMIVSVVDTYTSIKLLRNGFTHYLQDNWASYFPQHLFAHWSKKSPTPRLSYWYRPHRSTTKRPFVFIHGIGIGLWPYVPFLLELIKEDPEVGIFAIEIYPISMRISPPPLNRYAMLEAIRTILDFHQQQSFVLSGHSYGTIIATHMLKDPELQSRIVGTLFVDPIPFLLHLPAVAFNFLYREPKTANEWQLWYFASRDADIARTLARHFFWIENILWNEELKGRQVGVVLSGRDQIVDSVEVWRYLTDTREGKGDPKFHWTGEGLDVYYYPECDHATVFDTKRDRRPLVEMVSKFVRNNSVEDAQIGSGSGPDGNLLENTPLVRNGVHRGYSSTSTSVESR